MTEPLAAASNEVVVVLSTAPDAAVAERLAAQLLEENLIACTSLMTGVVSIFQWQGASQRENEVLMVMKTARHRVPRLMQRVPELHPYEVPELLVLPVEAALASYCSWVVGETTGESA